MKHCSGGTLLAVVACIASVSCGCGGGRESPKFPIRVVMSAQVYTFLPVILAPALGYYDEEELAVQIENVQSASRAVQALSGGSADVSAGTFG